MEEALKVCSNPNCHKKFENLILISDYSKNPTNRYYGCPYCFFKLDTVNVQKLETNEILVEEAGKPQKITSEDNVQESCPHYFGYLCNHYKDTIISKQCLLCSRMSGCMLKGQQEIKKESNTTQ